MKQGIGEKHLKAWARVSSPAHLCGEMGSLCPAVPAHLSGTGMSYRNADSSGKMSCVSQGCDCASVIDTETDTEEEGREIKHISHKIPR